MELDRRKTMKTLNIPSACFCRVKNAIDIDSTFNNFLKVVSDKTKENHCQEEKIIMKRCAFKVILKTYGVNKQHYSPIINSMAKNGFIRPINKQKIEIL